jgi:hypothetical protein
MDDQPQRAHAITQVHTLQQGQDLDGWNYRQEHSSAIRSSFVRQ